MFVPRNKSNAFCCGAGGGHMWVEESKGKRINVARTEEAQATGAQVIATACPFCIQMFEDGIPTVQPDEDKRMKTFDVAELLELTAIGRPNRRLARGGCDGHPRRCARGGDRGVANIARPLPRRTT